MGERQFVWGAGVPSEPKEPAPEDARQPIAVGTPFHHKDGWSGVVLANDTANKSIAALDPNSTNVLWCQRSSVTVDAGFPAEGNLRPVYVINQPTLVPTTSPVKLSTIVFGVFLGQLLTGIVAIIILGLTGVIR